MAFPVTMLPSQLALIGVNRAQETDSEGARRTKPSACRDIRKADDFEGTQAMKLNGFPNDWMLQLAGVGDSLLRRITDNVFAGESLVDTDIDIFVDGSRNKSAAESLIVRRKVGSSTTDRNTQGGASYDHWQSP